MWGRRETQALASAEASASPGASGKEAASPLSAETTGIGAGEQQAPGADTSADGAAVQFHSPALDEKTQAFWHSKLRTANFGGAVALFMGSPAHKHYTLADLEWLLLPALRLNQLMAAEVKLPSGSAVLAALVLWARVSAEVDVRLSAAPGYPIRLHPNE